MKAFLFFWCHLGYAVNNFTSRFYQRCATRIHGCIEPVYSHGPLGGSGDRAQDSHEGACAGAVRSQQTEESGSKMEMGVFEDLKLSAVAGMAELINFNCVGVTRHAYQRRGLTNGNIDYRNAFLAIDSSPNEIVK